MSATVAVFPGGLPPALAGAPGAVYPLIALLTAAFAFRRVLPVAQAVVIALGAFVVPSWFLGPSTYAVAAHARRPGWLWAVAPLMVLASFVGSRGWDDRVNDQALPAAAVVGFGLLGLYVGSRRRLLAAAEEQARSARRERELLAEQARAEERVRLAGEMHDVVAHQISLVVLQAGALGTRGEPDVVAGAEEIRLRGVRALAELRAVVGVLRTGAELARGGGATRGGGPVGGDDLAALVADARTAGLDVTLLEHGDPGRVDPSTRRAVRRVVGESMTNAARHAPGAAVRVEADHGPPVTVTVRNTRATSTGAPLPAGGGTGLDGLRARVAMLGGSLAAAPDDDGGFVVVADLPGVAPDSPVATSAGS